MGTMTEPRRIEFDGWTLQVETGELRRDRHGVRLQKQPLQVLLELMSRPGELVAREHLIARLWPKGVVDFDAGLNTIVRKLRLALKDDRDSPRYIETVPRRGYRYIGPAPLRIETPTPPLAPAAVAATESSPQQVPRRTLEHAPAPIAEQAPVSAPAPAMPIAPSRWRQSRAYVFVAITAAALAMAVSLRDHDEPRHEKSAALAATLTRASFATIAVLPLRSIFSNERARARADAFTAALRDSLSGVDGLAVIPAASIELAGDNAMEAGRRLNARYVLHGNMSEDEGDARWQLELLDIHTAKPIWSIDFADPLNALVDGRNHIVKNVTHTLRLRRPPVDTARQFEIEAYEILARAKRLLTTQLLPDAEEATQLFARAAELDPQLARAHLGVADALLLRRDLAVDRIPGDFDIRVERALARALEIETRLGEAWISKARLIDDAAQAEVLYRRGIDLSPAYGPGYASFAAFLIDRERRGEAADITYRGLELDPLSPLLAQSNEGVDVHPGAVTTRTRIDF
jgi:DNA-binding winged helix-turn-helix (wHTH) protein/TolB-like protein